MFGGSALPDDFLTCHGQRVAIADYPPLYATIRNLYGPSDAETFALPDLRGKIPMGRDSRDKLGSSLSLEPGDEMVEALALTHAICTQGRFPSRP